MRSSSNILAVPPTGRAAIVGRTGSGKSTLARAMLLPWPYVLVIDSKQEFELPSAVIVDEPGRLSRMSKRHEAPILFRPRPEYDNITVYNQVLRWAFDRRNCTVYVDEVFDLMRGNQPAPNLIKLLKQGRSRHVRTIVSTQRPRSIPISLLSESDRYYCFDLLLKDDRTRMSEVMGPDVMVPPPARYEFWYYDLFGAAPPVLCKLKKGGSK